MHFLSRLFNFAALQLTAINTHCKVYSFHTSYESLRGKHIEIQSGSRIDSSSSIGAYTYVGCYCYITRSKIGRYVSIANNVSIGQGEHDLSAISTSSHFYTDAWKTLTNGECEIGNDVWVGVDAIILRGVNVGNGAVIAANAVVTKDVPPFAIVAGVPATILKYRFPSNIQEEIKKTAWWDRDIMEAREIQAKLNLGRAHS